MRELDGRRPSGRGDGANARLHECAALLLRNHNPTRGLRYDAATTSRVRGTEMLKRTVKALIEKTGYTVQKSGPAAEAPIIPHGVIEERFARMYEKCRPYTMTTAQEMYNLYNATQYVVANGVPGDFVECGVWRGGSAMITALTLLELHDSDRKLYLYDTYEGMPTATSEDITHHDQGAGQVRERLLDEHGKWNFAPIEEVRSNLLSTGFPEDRLVLVKGKVEDTIPGTLAEAIAILRLDTDFYDSTYHEFKHLFPRLSSRGVLIVDDYDYWKGARRATDQYFSENGVQLLLQRMDVGRIGVKL